MLEFFRGMYGPYASNMTEIEAWVEKIARMTPNLPDEELHQTASFCAGCETKYRELCHHLEKELDRRYPERVQKRKEREAYVADIQNGRRD
jgi:hypothetical protein